MRECEFRDNHRCAVVVQDLATQWIQSYPCKTNSSHETEEVCQNSWSRRTGRKLYFPTTRWILGQDVKISWNHRTSTPHRSETRGIAERAVRRERVLLQSGIDEKWWSDSMERYCYLRNVQDLLADGRTPHEIRLGEPVKRPVIAFGSMIYHPISTKDQPRLHQFGKKVFPGILALS